MDYLSFITYEEICYKDTVVVDGGVGLSTNSDIIYFICYLILDIHHLFLFFIIVRVLSSYSL